MAFDTFDEGISLGGMRSRTEILKPLGRVI